ncbi:hypothetical protein GM921_10420 [Pedobacter sp. LMG 31464]|uniref:Uncharacterized protein n=1 Tax=Pedobacter planticolens TaxID=2679964 RepID=A0A923IX39_9SPHI|nr:hypothetical protein [Pedobacter planticolens]MBB2145902.1 hypothetical protein [Pedobacter planticolens]
MEKSNLELIKFNAKRIARVVVDFTRNLIFDKNGANRGVFLISSSEIRGKEDEIIKRLRYFDNKLDIHVLNRISPSQQLDYSLIGIVDSKSFNVGFSRLKINEVFNFDYEVNHIDGWEYHYLLSKVYKNDCEEGIQYGKRKLNELKLKQSKEYSKAYILGTGPSLEKADEVDWSDGIRIVSNTIVKDYELFKYIDPHYIVAGDAIYHFGMSKFAESFRADLRHCLSLTNTYFVFPVYFYPFCLKQFPEFKDRLIPVPQGKSELVHFDLTQRYLLPLLGNVLPLLLLPLACTLSKNINLWGFDGRSPNDKLFWKNSSRHFYTDLVQGITQLHPAFFEKLVPKEAPESYVKTVHGDVLDHALSVAEEAGFIFTMMHFSYTETLSKRYAKN